MGFKDDVAAFKAEQSQPDAAAPVASEAPQKSSFADDVASFKAQQTQPPIRPTGVKQTSKSAFQMGLEALGNEAQAIGKDPLGAAASIGQQVAGGVAHSLAGVVDMAIPPGPSEQSLQDQYDQEFKNNPLMGPKQPEKQFPMLSLLSRGTGEFLPAATAEGAVIGPVAAKGLSLVAKTPVGQALVQGASQIPGGMQALLKIVNPTAPAARVGFMQGVQEEAEKQLKNTNNKGHNVDWGKMFSTGIERAEEFQLGDQAMHGVGKIVSEGAAKIWSKLGLSKASQMAKAAEAAQKAELEQAEQQRALDQRIQQGAEAKQAREQAFAEDRMKIARERYEQAQRDTQEANKRMWKAEDEAAKLRAQRMQQGNPQNKRTHERMIAEAESRAQAAKQRADYFQKLHDDAAAAHAQELEHYQSSQADVGEQVQRTAGEQRSQIAQEKQPFSITRNTNPSKEEVTANREAERRALTFLKKSPNAAPPVEPPRATAPPRQPEPERPLPEKLLLGIEEQERFPKAFEPYHGDGEWHTYGTQESIPAQRFSDSELENQLERDEIDAANKGLKRSRRDDAKRKAEILKAEKERRAWRKSKGLPQDWAPEPEPEPEPADISARPDAPEDKSHDFNRNRERVETDNGEKFRTSRTDDAAKLSALFDEHPGLRDAISDLQERIADYDTEDREEAIRQFYDAVNFTDETPEAKGILDKALADTPTLAGAGPAEAFAFGANVLKQLWNSPEARRDAYNTLMHAFGVQKDTDILKQYAPELANAWVKAGRSLANLPDLAETFKHTAGKIKFGQMGAGKLDPGLIGKAMRGQLKNEDLAAVTPEAKRALLETQKAIRDYVEAVEPIKKWLDENVKPVMVNGKDITEHTGLGRLQSTLDSQLRQFSPLGTREEGKGIAKQLNAGAMAWMFLGKAKNSVIHLLEKTVAIGAREGIGLPQAMAKLAPGVGNATIKDFVKQTAGDGIISEALEDLGVNEKLKNGALDMLTGRAIERHPNAVATVIGLEKTARKMGYTSGEALAKDIMAAREGKGPLAFNTERVTRAMGDIQDYVSDITGSNVKGFKDRNVFQRNPDLKAGNALLVMPTVQARNLHRLVQEFVAAPNTKQGAIAAAKVSAYMGGLYLAAGDKGVLTKEEEAILRGSMGAPGYYKFMDGIHAARALTQLPAQPHLQQAIIPMLGGGISTYQLLKEQAQQGMNAAERLKNGKGDAMDNAIKAGKITALCGAQLLGTFGGGTALDYAKAGVEGARGYKNISIYQKGLLGDEKRVATVPLAHEGPLPVRVLGALNEAYWGLEGNKEQEIRYQAEKTTDLRNWVMQQVGAKSDEWKEIVEGEGDLDAAADLHDLRQEKSETLKDLTEAYGENSDQVRGETERYTRMMGEGDLQTKFWRQRAGYWQNEADRLVRSKQSKPAQAPFSIAKGAGA